MIDTFLTLGILQALILILLLWKKRKINSKLKANLIGLLFLSACILFGRVTFQPNLFIKYGAFIALTDVLLFMFGPLIYFMTRGILKVGSLTKRQILIHFTPALFHAFVLNTLIGLIILKKIPNWGKNEVLILYKIIEFGGIACSSFYLIKSFLIYKRKKNDFYNNYASPHFPEFLKYFIIICSTLVFIWFSGFAMFQFNIALKGQPWIIYSIFWICITVSIYLLTYYILSKPELLNMPELKMANENSKKEIEVRDNSLLESQKNELINYMASSKAFLDSEISLDYLAEKTDIKRHDLSYIINAGFGLNFFDFINKYRIIEFIQIYKQRTIVDNNLTFIEVAFETGFNSKSAFYRAFKKEKEQTPSQYFEKEYIRA